jgi:hypothetical protein
VTQACGDCARTILDGEYAMAAYLPSGAAVPGDGDPALPQVAVQIVVRPAMGAGGSSSRLGPGGGAMGMTSPTFATRGGRSARVLLARFPSDANVSAASGGVLDPGDGLGGRVVKLADGDRLFVPGPALGLGDGDAEIKVKVVSTDGTCWLAECGM